MQKQLQDFTEVELKALKADIYEDQARLNQNLNVINTELARRASTTPDTETPVEETTNENSTPEQV
jgi:hypothetical protein